MRDKVWKLLTIEEQTTLALVVQEEKSSWEAGEIMGKTHYKYLELKLRAEKFYRLFTEYLKENGELIPEESKIAPHFRRYLELVIGERRTVRDACNLMTDKSYSVNSLKDNTIIIAVNELMKSSLESDQRLLGLIFEFDRWNNFRILPLKIQQPSAYKRRIKTKMVKQIKTIGAISDIVMDRVVMKFKTLKETDIYYASIITLKKDKKYSVITVNNDEETVKTLSRVGVFIFKNEGTAIEFARLICNYLLNENRNPLDGQKFWPSFRDLSGKAVNFGNISNIVYTNTYLENAFIDLELIKKRKKNPDETTKRTDEKTFWEPQEK